MEPAMRARLHLPPRIGKGRVGPTPAALRSRAIVTGSPTDPASVREEADAPREGLLELAPVDDEIEHPVLQEKLGALEPLGELLTNGLLDHPRPRKADEGAGLCDVQVAD